MNILGINYHTIYDGLYVFDAETGIWIPPPDALPPPRDDMASVALVATVAALSGLAGSILFFTCGWFLYRRLHLRPRHLIQGVKKMIWGPRYDQMVMDTKRQALFMICAYIQSWRTFMG